MRKVIIFYCVLILGVFCGCASIVSKSQYPVSINSNPSGATVTVKNNRGVELHKATTPTTISLRSGKGYFSPAKYSFEFQKEGYYSSSASLAGEMDGWYFGNIIFGGLIGMLIVDPATGAMWRLDDIVSGNLSSDPDFKAFTPVKAEQIKGQESFSSSQDVSEELKKIKELKDLGVLTDEEYEAKRKNLVDQL